jgi:hypothetical protein
MLNILSIVKQSIVPVILIVITFIVTRYGKKFLGFFEDQKTLNLQNADIQRTILKNEIVKQYKSYEKQKFVSLEEKQIINELYDHYKKLGGNGFVEGLMLNINSLPNVNNKKI